MSEEEKKAYDTLIMLKYFTQEKEDKEAIQIILNLIESQQKEIEELKEKNEKIEAINYSVNKNLLETTEEIEELKKDKLELINKYHVVHLKDVEKELREMRKAIDTKNAEIECLNVIHESYKEMVAENNYIRKDKIKAKIEEINKEMLNEENSLELFYRKKYCCEVLQSLLEEG